MNCPRATKQENEYLDKQLRIPTTTQIRIITTGRKYIMALVIIGGEWQEIKFIKEGFIKVAKLNNLIQTVNRKQLLLNVARGL